MTCIGLYCNFHFHIQEQWVPLATDVGNCFKIFITYIGASIYFKTFSERETQRFLILCGKSIVALVYIMFVFAIINGLGNIGMGQDIRYGIHSFSFIFDGEANFLMTFYLLVPMLIFSLKTYKMKKQLWMIILVGVIYVSTLRSRAFVYVLVLCVLFYYMIYRNKQFHLNWRNILLFSFGAIYICYDQIKLYTDIDNGQTARYALLINGFDIAKELFPVGYGFGTYGTDVAAKFYSVLYDQLGFNNVYGLSQDFSAFARDDYWPAILGQFGFIGLIIFGLCLYCLFKDMFVKSKDKYLKLIAILVCFSLCLSSTADAAFFHYVTVCSMFFLAFIFNSKKTLKFGLK